MPGWGLDWGLDWAGLGWAGGWQLQKRGMRKHKLGGGENGEKRGMVKLNEHHERDPQPSL